MLLPAFNIGEAELRSCLRTLQSHDAIDRVLLVAARSAFADAGPDLAFIDDDFTDVDRLEARIRTWCREHDAAIDSIVGIDEELHFSLSRTLASRFGLPFHSEETCYLASNKALCKAAFVREGVPTSPFVLLSEPLQSAILRIGLPCMLKAMSGTQSQFSFKIESMQEAESSFRRMKDAMHTVDGDPRFAEQHAIVGGESIHLDPKRQFLLEGFVGGVEYSCDFLVTPSSLRVIRVTKKLPGPELGIFAGYLFLDEEGLRREHIDPSSLQAVCAGIARALRVDDAVCMVDFKIADGAIVVLEASVRPGFSAFNELMFELLGYTSLGLMVLKAAGRPVPETKAKTNGAVVYLVAPNGSSAIKDTARLERRSTELGITAIHRFADEPAAAIDPSVRLKGYAISLGFRSGEVDQVVRAIQEEVTYG